MDQIWILTPKKVSFGEQNLGNSKKNNFLKATKFGSCEQNLGKKQENQDCGQTHTYYIVRRDENALWQKCNGMKVPHLCTCGQTAHLCTGGQNSLGQNSLGRTCSGQNPQAPKFPPYTYVGAPWIWNRAIAQFFSRFFCRLLSNQLTNLSAAFKPADKPMLYFTE
jgi:hypothetical protein